MFEYFTTLRRPCIPLALVREGVNGILPYIISNPSPQTEIHLNDKIILMGEF